ncbi:glycosyltransferase family 2 protein [Desulfovibrio inopinatus]|uniref:glycosyltransferase family 2 protein n=1 Tax=Desulfovibrio inopinatus TaxID=102109 RepID=UPI00040FAD10|nr:glycosyltransferase family 2 protein [Desulfovibrio inopinatus]
MQKSIGIDLNQQSTLLHLAIIMPVYNEEDAIKGVLMDWVSMQDALSLDYELHVYNDGSTDNTAEVVRDVEAMHPCVVLHDRKENWGHGPTILAAYREHLHVPWIFQTDSDGEIGPEHFPELWEKREDYDLLLGYRTGRKSLSSENSPLGAPERS